MNYLLLALLFLITSCGSSKPQLHIYAWADFFSPEVIAQFEEVYNCDVVIDTFDSNEAMYVKLKLGGEGYDLITASNYYLDIMQSQGMLENFDLDRIDNFKYYDERLSQLLDSQKFKSGIPYLVGFSGIGWRKDKVSLAEPSWALFDDATYRGRMTLLNDPREALGAALRYLGFSVNTRNPKELELAKEQLIKWKKNLAKFESEQYKNGIATGEYLAVQGYSGDLLQVLQENPRVDFATPKEGAPVSVDFLVIPKGATNQKLAYAFMNFLYEPEIAAKTMNATCFLSPNIAAYDKVDPVIQSRVTNFLSEETLKKSELIQDLGADIVAYNKVWEQVKAAK